MQRSRSYRGFTLIELLVVIAIIGILASIVLASLGSARAKGRDAKRVSDIKQLQLALELYYDQNSAYPVSIAAGNLVSNNYISSIPTDPSTGANYSYAALQGAASTVATCGSYHLGATLESAGNTALSSDTDGQVNATAGTYGTTSASPVGTYDGPVCTGSAADFAGTDPVFDARP